MVELTQFAEADFDPKTWINNACQQAAEGDMERSVLYRPPPPPPPPFPPPPLPDDSAHRGLLYLAMQPVGQR